MRYYLMVLALAYQRHEYILIL